MACSRLTGQRPGHHLGLLAPLDRDQPARLCLLAVAAACQRAADSSARVLELIPVTVPELLRQLRGTVIPEPRRDKPHRDAWTLWRRRHQYDAQQAHQRWHAYADETPR